MKKLMFAVAAMTAGIAMADVTSANIVGYSNTAAKDKVYIALGPTFITTGNSADATFTLNSVMKPGDGYNWMADKMYLVNPDSCAADKELVYVEGLGWINGYDFSDPVGDLPLAVGTGFQSSYSGSDFTVTSSGEVFGDGYSIGCNGKIYQYPVNATGRDITWSEVAVSGAYNWMADKLYVINPETCAADHEIVFVDGLGWYAMTPTMADFNAEPIKAGEGFQTAFSGNDITISFPPTFPEAE